MPEGAITAAAQREERNLILATAGHVDHGKSALVKALTGTDPDRLPEEKARGITIDLGFAHLRIGRNPVPAAIAPSSEELPDLSLGIVDVPGHEDFIKNMVAGVGAIDLALLVVAADDGWMPQTEEHLQILTYLGVSRGVVALSKIDRVSPEEAEAKAAAVRARLAGTPLAPAPLIGTSVHTGAGLEELRRALAAVAQAVPPRVEIGRPRLWIDRAFTLRGAGTIVTGTLAGGRLSVGQIVRVAPLGVEARIRSIQNHNRSRDTAVPGTRTALNLVGVETRVGEGTSPGGVARGMVVTDTTVDGTTAVLNAWLQRASRSPGPMALAQGSAVRLYVGTTSVAARVVLAEADVLAPGACGVAQLRLATRLALQSGDRFVLRDTTNRLTLGGGVVLDADPGVRRFRSDAELKYLHAVAAALLGTVDGGAGRAACVRHAVVARLERDEFVSERELVRALPFTATEVQAAVQHVLTSRRGVAVETAVALRRAWERAREHAGQAIAQHHATHPTQVGLPLVHLRIALRKVIAARTAFDPLIAELGRDGFEIVGAAIRRRGFTPQLPDALAAAAARVRAVLATRGLDPPTRRALAPDQARNDALLFLIKTGQVIALTPEVLLLGDHFERAAEGVRRFLAVHGAGTVSELRQALGASRRVVVPLLEKLDRDGVTMRVGDERQLRRAALV